MLYVTVDPGTALLCGGPILSGIKSKNGQGGPIHMMKMKKGCRALIVALVMMVFCNFVAFGDEVAEPAGSAVESVMDDAADTSASESTDSETDEVADSDSDSASEPDGSEAEDAPEPKEKKDDDQSSFDSGKKEDHSSFDEWDFPEPTPEPQPEPVPEPTPEPQPETPEPAPTPEPEKPEVPVAPEPEKPEIPVVPVVPEPTPQPEPTPEHWHDDDDDDDDVIVVIPKKPVVTAETDMVPVVKTFEVLSGDTLPTPEETPTPKTEIPETPSSELPKTGDSSLALYAFLASAFGLVVLLASSFIGRHNTDETAKEVPARPQMCCGPQRTKETGKDVSVKAARSSGRKSAPSRFGLRCKNCVKIVLALTHPGWGLFVSKSR